MAHAKSAASYGVAQAKDMGVISWSIEPLFRRGTISSD